MRLLLVDDHADFRHLLKRVLARDGRWEVVGEAADGAQGVAEARRLQPDFVLLDLSMPVMDGLEALPRLEEACPRARVVVMSGFERERLEPTVLALGAEAYVEKGLRPEEILEALAAAAAAPLRGPPARAAERDALMERARMLV